MAQNRALSEAQEQLKGSRERYVDLFDFAPVACFTLEEDVRIVEPNIAAASARRIVEAHAGTMWVESTSGRGATFHRATGAAHEAGASAWP